MTSIAPSSTPSPLPTSELVSRVALPRDGRLRVWAPSAHRVDAHLPGERGDLPAVAPMTRDEDLAAAGRPGWWLGPQVPPGTDYLFAVDGGEPRPDPRSSFQPTGVHTASRTFDPAAFAWTDADFAGVDALGAVTYELHIGTFTPAGTLDSAIERLDHLARLGVQLIELMPVAAFPGERGWGYDGVCLYAVHEAYGGPQALQRFVDAAHARGMGVLLDAVYNHLGPAGNYLGVFGPYFTDRHVTPWGSAVNLDGADSREVRAFIVENALHWMRDFHVDGLRLDAVHALVDDSATHILADISDATAELSREVGRPLALVAESDLNDHRMVTPTDEEAPTGPGLGMTGQWADDVHHALHSLVTGESQGYYADFGSVAALAKVLEDVFVHDGRFSTFRGQIWGAPVPDGVDRRRFTVFSQNHDQVGNRAIGDRPSRTLGPAQLIGSAALVILGPFTPMLFQGEEWGTRTPFQYFTDHDAQLGAAVSAGRLSEFASHGWEELYGHAIDVPDPQARSTFENSTLDWDDLAEDGHRSILAAYRELIALRAGEADIASGDVRAMAVSYDPGGGWIRMRRGAIDVVVGLAEGTHEVPLDGEVAERLFAFGSGVTHADGAVRIDGHGVSVLRVA